MLRREIPRPAGESAGLRDDAKVDGKIQIEPLPVLNRICATRTCEAYRLAGGTIPFIRRYTAICP